MRVRLVVVTGELTGQEFQLDKAEFGIGRAPDNSICIPNPAVSRTHARVFHRDGIWYLVDLQSTHGTRLNGVVVGAPAQLRAGDMIQVGDTIIRFEVSEPLAVAAPPPLQPGATTKISTVQHPVAAMPPGPPPPIQLDAHDKIRVGALIILSIFVVMAVFMLLFPKPKVSTGPSEADPGTTQATETTPAPPAAQIRIDNVRLVPWQSPTTGEALQMVLVDWTNKSGKKVNALTATITLYDARGREIERIEDYHIYAMEDYGGPVQPEQSFIEPMGDGHVIFPNMYGEAARVRVQIERVIH